MCNQVTFPTKICRTREIKKLQGDCEVSVVYATGISKGIAFIKCYLNSPSESEN